MTVTLVFFATAAMLMFQNIQKRTMGNAPASLTDILNKMITSPNAELETAIASAILSEGTNSTMMPHHLYPACLVAEALTNNEPPLFNSYHCEINVSSTQHVTALLCNMHRQQQHQQVAERQQPTPTKHTKGGGVVVLTFKVARTGSTFFTDVITQAIKSTNQMATQIWEPFSNRKCYHRLPGEVEEEYFKSMVTGFCKSSYPVTIDTKRQWKNKPWRWKNQTSKCYPTHSCRPFDTEKKEFSVVSQNPRFSDRARWGKLLADVPPAVEVIVFNLRRTNLVKQAYSKYHHGLCPVLNEAIGCHKNEFTFECLIACAANYGLGEQEFASSVAYSAVLASSQQQGHYTHPHLVVYEDVLNDKKLASERLLNFLGIAADTLVFDKTDVRQEHGEDFCGYNDIDCPALEKSLSEGGYSCLLKQLSSSNTVAWTVPQRKVDRGIDINGDCEVLRPLSSIHPDRNLVELYI